MCTLSGIKLQVSVFSWFKLALAIYVFGTGCYFTSSSDLKQAFGLVYVDYGTSLIFLALLSGFITFPMKFGVNRHNKCLLLLSFVMDTIVFAELINYALILQSYVAPEYSKTLQLDCLRNTPLTYTTTECQAYLESDRVAGMRLLWETYYTKKSNKFLNQVLTKLEATGSCCGFFQPFRCIENTNEFPIDRYQSNVDSSLLKQRVTCSNYPNYYPEQNDCINYYDFTQNPPIVGGCYYDLGVGYCLKTEITKELIGCASAVEDYAVSLITPHILLFSVAAVTSLLFMTYSCCMWWKRKEYDIFPEFTTLVDEKVKYNKVKDQFEIIPKRNLLIKEGFVPPPIFKNIIEKKIHVANNNNEEKSDSKDDEDGNNKNKFVVIYDKSKDDDDNNNNVENV